MKRYLIISDMWEYEAEVLGVVDDLAEVDAVVNTYAMDTQTGMVYCANSDGEFVPEGVMREYQKPEPEKTREPEPRRKRVWLDVANGDDSNDGLDINRPKKTLVAAMSAEVPEGWGRGYTP